MQLVCLFVTLSAPTSTPNSPHHWCPLHTPSEMSQAASNDHGLLNELLIAKLLEEDMQMLENTLMAEELQVHETLDSSAMAAGLFPKKRMRTGAALKDDQDHNVVLGVLAAEVRANKDALLAQSLQHSEDSNMAISRQYALKLAASEKKSLLDAEFARRLQQALDDGEDVDMTGDAERSACFRILCVYLNSLIRSMLGRDAIEDIIVCGSVIDLLLEPKCNIGPGRRHE